MFVFTDFWRPMHEGTDRQTNTQRDGGLVLQWSDLFWTSQFEINILLAREWATAYSIMLSVLYAIARPSVCPSVSHTGGSVKIVEVKIMKYSPYGRAILPLVFAG